MESGLSSSCPLSCRRDDFVLQLWRGRTKELQGTRMETEHWEASSFWAGFRTAAMPLLQDWLQRRLWRSWRVQKVCTRIETAFYDTKCVHWPT